MQPQGQGTLFLNSEDLDNAQGLDTKFLAARESYVISQVFILCKQLLLKQNLLEDISFPDVYDRT